MTHGSQKSLDTVLCPSVNERVFDVGAYVRLSAVDRKHKGDSIETQQAIINAYLSERNDLALREVYIDNGLSGQSFERPGFQKMIEDMKRGAINCCVTKDLSRLGRNAMETGYYVEKYFPLNNIRFIAITDNYDSCDERTGGIMISLKNLINEIYALDVGRKIRATKQMHIRCGYFIGRFPPYGYLKSPDNKYSLIPDGYAAPIIRQIYEMAAEGHGVKRILNWINEAGILPPKRYFHTIGIATEKEACGHIHWNKGTLYGILHNRVYCGDMVQGKFNTHSYVQKKAPEESWIITENTHEPLVNRELFAKVQALWDKPEEPTMPKFKTPSSNNIFLRKVFCAHCGYAMRRDRIDENHYYFKCDTRQYYHKDDCILVTIKEKDLKARLVEQIRKEVLVFTKGKRALTLLAKADEADKKALYKLQAEINEKTDVSASLYMDYRGGNITETEFKELKQTINNQISDMKKEEEYLNKSIRDRRLLNASRVIASACFQSVTKRSDLNEEIIDALVEKIRVFEDKHIEVDFKFREEAKSCSVEHCLELIKHTDVPRRNKGSAVRQLGQGGADSV